MFPVVKQNVLVVTVSGPVQHSWVPTYCVCHLGNLGQVSGALFTSLCKEDGETTAHGMILLLRFMY